MYKLFNNYYGNNIINYLLCYYINISYNTKKENEA